MEERRAVLLSEGVDGPPMDPAVWDHTDAGPAITRMVCRINVAVGEGYEYVPRGNLRILIDDLARVPFLRSDEERQAFEETGQDKLIESLSATGRLKKVEPEAGRSYLTKQVVRASKGLVGFWSNQTDA